MEVCPSLGQSFHHGDMIPDGRRRGYGKRSVVVLLDRGGGGAVEQYARVQAQVVAVSASPWRLPSASVDPETELMIGPAVGTTVKADGQDVEIVGGGDRQSHRRRLRDVIGVHDGQEVSGGEVAEVLRFQPRGGADRAQRSFPA